MDNILDERIFLRWTGEGLLRVSVITVEPDDELSDRAICLPPIIGSFLTDVISSQEAFDRFCAAMTAVTGKEYGIMEAQDGKD